MAALPRIAPNLRRVLTPHVSLQLVDRCRLRAADNIHSFAAQNEFLLLRTTQKRDGLSVGLGGSIMKYILAILFFAFFVEGATAADLPQAVPARAPAPVAALPISYNWSGFYIGAMGGGGWSTSQGVDFKGGFAGGTLGANAQFSNFVLGGELEGAWSDIGQTASALFGLVSATDQIQAFGSAAVRAGFAFDNVLFYGKGGFAAASNKLTVSVLGLSASDTETHLGYTVGAGVEYGFTPNWSAKVEYLFASYGSKNYFASVIPPGAPSGSFDVNTVKFGINYRFGWGGPVSARY